MSYCRWSSMNWRCDVYVYEHSAGGWTTHVAGRRRIIPPIPALPFPRHNFGGVWDADTRRVEYPNWSQRLSSWFVFGFWAFWYSRIHMVSLDLIPLRKIGLAHDGKTFNDGTAGACADRLEWLGREGYKVPQCAIDELREEQRETERSVA